MAKFIGFLLLLFVTTLGFSQVATDNWHLYVTYNQPTGIATDHKVVMCAFRNGMLEYDLTDKQNYTWSYTNYLSDVDVTAIYYDSLSASFWIGYANGNIDKITNNTVFNIPALKLANIIGSKRINSFTSSGDGAVYAVADFGILKLNPEKNEISETFYTNNLGERNIQMALLGDSLFVLTPHHLFSAKKTNPILSDYNQWQNVTPITLTDDTIQYSAILSWNNRLLLVKKLPQFNDDQIWEWNGTTLAQVLTGTPNEWAGLTTENGHLLAIGYYHATSYDTNYQPVYNFYQYTFANSFQPRFMVEDKDGTFYIADQSQGLVEFSDNWNNQSLSPDGPPDNTFYRATSLKDKLLFSSGTINGAGATYHYPKAYALEDGKWKSFDPSTEAALDSIHVWDLNGVAIDPKDKNHMAISACGQKYALFIFTDGTNISKSFGMPNSEIEKFATLDSLTCISEVKFDQKGNLWFLNTFSNYPLKVLTADGVMYKFDTGAQTRQHDVENLTIDNDGHPWFAVPGIGIVGYNTNGTISDASDDSYKILDKGEFSGALPNNDVTDIVKDVDGKLWITTTQGFSILSNPSSVFGAAAGDYNTYRPKIQFGGETEYFFGETYITCGIVDGGNRKWFGTIGSGLFCIAPDGYSILKQYNSQNSRLISDHIYDLEFNNETGELFVITDQGLISLGSGASDAVSKYGKVLVYPNPVQPEYHGVITIRGLKYNSDVKITDIAGNIVYKTTSNGGTAVWDGNKVNGEPVSTGVYLIWTAPKDGKGGKVAKVTIIR